MRILSGTLKHGQHIDINALAKAIGVSTSPMREALCTLSAEGVLESTKGNGFHVPVFDFAATTDLLRWSDHLAVHSVKARAPPNPEMIQHDANNHVIRVLLLFRSIGNMAGNREISRALRNAALRLHGFYRVESAFLPDAADELAGLEKELEHRRAGLPKMIHAFHQRRIAILPKIARVVRDDI